MLVAQIQPNSFVTPWDCSSRGPLRPYGFSGKDIGVIAISPSNRLFGVGIIARLKQTNSRPYVLCIVFLVTNEHGLLFYHLKTIYSIYFGDGIRPVVKLPKAIFSSPKWQNFQQQCRDAAMIFENLEGVVLVKLIERTINW